MEDEGLLRSTWERSAGGRSRRRYELTEAGTDVVDSYVMPVEQVKAVAQANPRHAQAPGAQSRRHTTRSAQICAKHTD